MVTIKHWLPLINGYYKPMVTIDQWLSNTKTQKYRNIDDK